jgi:DNA-binding beta-propeller fold protein YncE
MRIPLSWLRPSWFVAAAAALAAAATPAADAANGFNVIAVIPLPGVAGRIDHLAYDPVDQWVFIAELGNNTVEAVNVAKRRVEHRLTGFSEPQGVAYSPTLGLLYVANGDGKVQSFRRDGLVPEGTVDVGPDADNVRVDDKARRVYVGHGKGAIAVLDARTLARIADIPLRGHPESFQLSPDDARLLVNVPDANEIAILDRTRAKQIDQWPNGAVRAANYPIVIDAPNHRLLSVFRKPARIVAYRLADGGVEAEVSTCADADDVFVDDRRHQVYVVCGEGAVEVLSNPGLKRTARLPTTTGARTGLFRADVDRLFVGARGNGDKPAALWVLAPTP